ncbi:hypothetical protein ACJJTC_013891 [Scirpophaga incertulas]
MMYHIKHQMIVASIIILNINADYWYPAGDTQERKLSQMQNYGLSIFSGLEHQDGRTLNRSKKKEQQNVTMLKNNNIKPDNPHTLNIARDEKKAVNNSNLKKTPQVLSYDNTVNIINVIKRKRPKKKIITRCREPVSRNTGSINFKHTSKPRFLEVFQVVEFDHVTCVSSSGLEGTCLHEYDCEVSGGSTMGTCADGYGTCCVTLFSCDGQSSEPVGWFTNPGFPSASSERLSCMFTLDKASTDVKQIRFDFVTFELLGPTSGTCQEDQFIISGQNKNSIVPILCGINSGQHVYIEVGDTDGPIVFSIQTISTDSRLFSIKVSQLTGSDELAAPTGCLQYHTNLEGHLESFNFKDTSEIGIARFPSYLNNLNYAMCIHRAEDACSITYVNDDYMQIVNYDLDGLPVIPKGQAGVEIFNCPSDWLLISATRLCGDRLNDGSVIQDFSLDAPVIDTNAGPLVVWFRSDEGYVGRGFKILYKQNICNNPASK